MSYFYNVYGPFSDRERPRFDRPGRHQRLKQKEKKGTANEKRKTNIAQKKNSAQKITLVYE